MTGERAWYQRRERGVWGYGVMRWLAGRAPHSVTAPLLWLIAAWFVVFPGSGVRAACRRYLHAALGREPGLGDRHAQVRCFALATFERFRLLGSGLDGFRTTLNGEECIRPRVEAGQPCILLGAHFGSFEVMRAAERTLPGLRVRYLMYQDHADRTAQTMARVNAEVAGRIIPVANGPEAMLAVREALEAGDSVAFLGDRLPVDNPRAMVQAEFLGAPVRLPRAPYVAALLAQVPLIVFFAPRIGRKAYEISFAEIHDGRPVPRGQRDALCDALAQRFADALGGMCRRHPYNWFNFFDIWGGRDVHGADAEKR